MSHHITHYHTVHAYTEFCTVHSITSCLPSQTVIIENPLVATKDPDKEDKFCPSTPR